MAESLEDRFQERNFLPALKPRKWQGRKAVFCRRLVEDDHDAVPLVAYGWDAEDRVDFVTREAIAEAGASKSKAHKSALRNLARRGRKLEWTRERYPLGKKKVSVAMLEGDEYTASMILIPEFLEAAHEVLDAEEIVIGVPHRFSIWACDAALAPLMVTLAQSQFAEAEEEGMEPVSPALILASAGKLVGIAVPDESGGGRSAGGSKDKARRAKERGAKASTSTLGAEDEDEGRSKRRAERESKRSGEGRSSKRSGEGRSAKERDPARRSSAEGRTSQERDPKRRSGEAEREEAPSKRSSAGKSKTPTSKTKTSKTSTSTTKPSRTKTPEREEAPSKRRSREPEEQEPKARASKARTSKTAAKAAPTRRKRTPERESGRIAKKPAKSEKLAQPETPAKSGKLAKKGAKPEKESKLAGKAPAKRKKKRW